MVLKRQTYLRETPSQTAGPYVHIGCTPNFTGIDMYGGDLGTTMKTGPVKGTEITIKGIVFDGLDTPLRDAMVEIWQPDAAGLFPSANETRGMADPNFTGWGRSPGDMDTGGINIFALQSSRSSFWRRQWLRQKS